MTRSASLLTLVSLSLVGCHKGLNGGLKPTPTGTSMQQGPEDGTQTNGMESAALVGNGGESTDARMVLSFRTHTVHLHAEERYTVEDASGNVLARGLSRAAFAKRFPDVYVDFEGVMNTNQSNVLRQRYVRRQMSAGRP